MKLDKKHQTFCHRFSLKNRGRGRILTKEIKHLTRTIANNTSHYLPPPSLVMRMKLAHVPYIHCKNNVQIPIPVHLSPPSGLQKKKPFCTNAVFKTSKQNARVPIDTGWNRHYTQIFMYDYETSACLCVHIPGEKIRGEGGWVIISLSILQPRNI